MLVPVGWHVIGTTRSARRKDAIAAQGVTPLQWSGDELDDNLAEALGRATHLLTSVSPGDDGDPVLNAMAGALAQARHLHWAGYLSTIGVYGDRCGDWVDEETAPDGTSARAKARIKAEAAWQELAAAAGWPLHVFRLAGIYGPGRGPFEKLRRGTAQSIIKPGQVFSRIHADDIGRVLLASINADRPSTVYNVCDDAPAPPQDVIGHAARLLGMEPPPPVRFEDADLSPMARSFYADSKRVHNDRIKRDLGVELLYPDYQSGLAAILRDEGG
ncbi:Nucleoside-diphosphate-sugar epimerase [Roseicitreum antarcticum]|uniref:Nucleoside-diphosphate-sugar epimerase n=1 Tax=Roseicitreum antarcticum TaxID=564137 RepID=A0A1H2XFA4_9RHOB|nr:Nucleoside-diphosphate-sugar epimerase [Roseicitreum antarcticum]